MNGTRERRYREYSLLSSMYKIDYLGYFACTFEAVGAIGLGQMDWILDYQKVKQAKVGIMISMIGMRENPDLYITGATGIVETFHLTST
jgi:hypothetical protein